MADGGFLATRTDQRPWSLPEGAPAEFEAAGLFLGRGPRALEIAVASAPHVPSATALRSLWNARHGNTPSPLLLVVTHPGPRGTSASVCGPVPRRQLLSSAWPLIRSNGSQPQPSRSQIDTPRFGSFNRFFPKPIHSCQAFGTSGLLRHMNSRSAYRLGRTGWQPVSGGRDPGPSWSSAR